MKKNKIVRAVLIFVTVLIIINFALGRILLEGVNKFYGLNQFSEVLMIGHSMLMLSVDKEMLENKTELSVSKYTREGVNVIDRYTMTKQYLESPYSDSLKYVLYGVDQFTFVGSGLSENSYKLFYPFMDNDVINDYVKISEDTKLDYFIHKVFSLTRYSDVLINASQRGWRGDYSNLKKGTLDIESLKMQMETGTSHHNRAITIDENLLVVFDETLKMITDRGVNVILVQTPVVDVLNEVDKDGYAKVANIFTSYTENNELIEYWDLNYKFSSDYSLFFDAIHLNPKGQREITEEVIKRINDRL
ncbi:hypothetical protein M2138_000326 [Dysgonomonadaceae bacterium PH5-43]|nr:hypothetical protein [Dysgonomonadaceae bacterium PH5-43]